MKHQYYEAIVAWANGEPIQSRKIGSSDWEDYITKNKGDWTPGFNFMNYEWRVKPKSTTVIYRLALVYVGIDNPVYEITAYHKHTGYKYDNAMPPRAVKWITDWIKYDVE